MNGIFQLPPVVYLRQYLWPVLMPVAAIQRIPALPPIQPPAYYVQNPTNIKYYLPYNQPIIIGSYFPQNHAYQQPQPTIAYNAPCVMRQVPIQMSYGYQQQNVNFKNYYQPQVIEAHQYVQVTNHQL